MPIFSRREIQKCIDSVSPIIGRRKLKHIITSLNIAGKDSNEKRHIECLSNIWEVVVLSLFSHSGVLKYEVPISNGKKPDINYHNDQISLIGDIFAVSDDQQRKKNPADEFLNIILKMKRKFGPKNGGLFGRIESIDIKTKNGLTVKRLALPPLDDLETYLQDKVYPFFNRLKRFPTEQHNYSVDEYYDPKTKVKFWLEFKPKQNFYSNSYDSFTQITDIKSHVLWRRLEDKENHQFKNATEDSVRIIFICDNGCSALKRNPKDVLDYFWNYSNSISAAVVLSIGSETPINLRSLIYYNPNCPYRLTESHTEFLKDILNKVPKPINSPENALNSIRMNLKATTHLGGLVVSDNKIQMSGIELLKILAGKMSLDSFCEGNSLDNNPFEDKINNLKTIKNIEVVPCDGKDDDIVTIEFRNEDSALDVFKIPGN
ncbi:hypothetical protein [uncultured Desulfobacter sp.]|uniref:hypothetical protein n=1 Tax=uncultured Desulfobacter sp. TaxID=240139 RepID=UPI002AA7186B|nr:hypothetical protein [uncultured Desulfobacter sp.]